MKSKTVFSLAMLWMLANGLAAQCPFNPTVEGDTLLCPNGTTTFTTQEYDAYQWYRRVYPDGSPELIAGETGQTLTLDDTGLLYYYWVAATDEGCTEASPEVLLDGYVFLLPFVVQTGEFEFDPGLQAIKICQGDTMFLHFNYGANITWFRNGEPIAGETSPVLAITESGAYTVEGAPDVCPDFVMPLGLELQVVVEPCATPVSPSPVTAKASVFPNPVTNWLSVEYGDSQPVQALEIISPAGQLLKRWEGFGKGGAVRVDVSDLPAGIYCLRASTAGHVTSVVKFVKE